MLNRQDNEQVFSPQYIEADLAALNYHKTHDRTLHKIGAYNALQMTSEPTV